MQIVTWRFNRVRGFTEAERVGCVSYQNQTFRVPASSSVAFFLSSLLLPSVLSRPLRLLKARPRKVLKYFEDSRQKERSVEIDATERRTWPLPSTPVDKKAHRGAWHLRQSIKPKSLHPLRPGRVPLHSLQKFYRRFIAEHSPNNFILTIYVIRQFIMERSKMSLFIRPLTL